MADFEKGKVTVKTLLSSESFQNYALRSSVKDIENWNKWLNENPDHKDIAEQASSIIHQIAFKKEGFDRDIIEQEWDRLTSIIDRDRAKAPGRLIRLYRSWQKIAAVLLIPVLIVSGLILINLNSAESDRYSVIFNQNTHRNKVILPDSSVIYLNTGSSIRYSDSYNRRDRELFLTGEGYFEVAKDPRKPFRVIINDHTITALGTKFTVRGYENEDFCRVILIEGKVSCESPGIQERVILKEGDKLTYLRETGEMVLDKSDIGIETAWINDMLIIENDLFDTLIGKLENWYGVHITIADEDSLINSRYRLRIKTESLRESLDLINYIIPIDYKIDGDEVVISMK